MADENGLERTAVLLPSDLKAQAVELAGGKRKLGPWIRDLVEREVGAAGGHPVVVPPQAEPSAVREEPSGITDLGSPVPAPTPASDERPKHVLVAISKIYPDPEGMPDLETVEMYCSCRQSFTGAGRNNLGLQKARAAWDAHSGAEPISGKVIAAVMWVKDDPTFGSPEDARLSDLWARAERGESMAEVREPAKVPDNTSLLRSGVMGIGMPAQPAVVTDLRERYNLVPASSIETPPKPPVEPEPEPEPEPEAAPTAGSSMCPTCFSPMSDGTCWSCASSAF